MRRYQIKNQLLMIILAVGFLIGILYENITARKYGVTVEIFQPYYLEQFLNTEISIEKYLLYVARVRFLPFAFLWLLGCLKWKKIFSVITVAWTGFLTGVLFVSAVVLLGVKGLLICVASIFPHILFYGMAYGMTLIYMFFYPKKQWNISKTVFVCLMLLIGILLEAYVNPFIVRMMVRWI